MEIINIAFEKIIILGEQMRNIKILSLVCFVALLSGIVLAADQLTITFDPNPVNAGATMNIVVSPTANGVSRYAYVYYQNRIYETSVYLCDTSKCYQSLVKSLNIPANWINGDYALSVYDYSVNRSKIFYFYVDGPELTLASASLSPEVVNAGSALTLSVVPGIKGVSKSVPIYKETGIYKTSFDLPCAINSSTCYNPVTGLFTVPTNWVNGRYYMEIQDNSVKYLANGSGNGTSSTARLYFTVVNGAEPRDLSVVLTPNPVSRGSALKIDITPGNEGIYSSAYVYDSAGRYKTSINLNCPTYRCYDPKTVYYTIPTTWTIGSYTMKIYDYNTNSYKNFPFNVI